MGLVMEHDESVSGYEAVPLAPAGQAQGPPGSGEMVLRRRSARPSRRAVVYVHCVGDAFVCADVADWYTNRGFHFYAADLREVGVGGGSGKDGTEAAEDLGRCFACLDAAVAHLRDADPVDTVVVSGHGTGALVAALWCHARRGSQPADALILASPDLGRGSWWPFRAKPRPGSGPRQAAPLVTGGQRRLRRGLDIACPVLVMCPAGGWDVPGGPGGLLASRMFATGSATVRLGEHVTWLKLDGGLPGHPAAGDPAPKRYFDELSRWLGAYLSGQIRDQLL